LKSAGLSSLDQCKQRDDKKGAFWVAVIDQKGRNTADLIAEFVPEIVRGFFWPKSMRWGEGEIKWVRPLHSVLCTFDGEVVPFEIDGVAAGDVTQGHRIMSAGDIQARSFDAYAAALSKSKVILDADERKDIIARDAASLCQAQGLELVEDAGLLAEVAGLAEWPVPMMGSFDEKFLKLPDEVLTASMRGHQKYFSVGDPKTGRLANRFVYVANLEATDGGKSMRTGYERVLTARLSDGWYLYNQDLKTQLLKDRIIGLHRVTFFEGLGSVGDKAKRIAALAEGLAPLVGADPKMARRAAMLAKADLSTGMVYEFPELQGIMGRYYALEQGEAPEIADAIRDHYKPAGQDDDVPTAPVSVAVALADKIDTLTAFWAIDKKPTGSSDPFALRRAALGVISLVLSSRSRSSLSKLADAAYIELAVTLASHEIVYRIDGGIHPFLVDDNGLDFGPHGQVAPREFIRKKLDDGVVVFNDFSTKKLEDGTEELVFKDFPSKSEVSSGIVDFFHDRLKVYLKDKGHKHDQIDAVLTDAEGNLQDDLVLIVAKLEALATFLKIDDGANLAAAYKRAANILKAEEKKDGVGRTSARQDETASRRAEARPTIDENLLTQPEEKSLFAALTAAETKAEKAVAAEDFEAAMSALAKLRGPLDAFFEKVTVNDDDKNMRANRLALLARLRAATARVADFSKLEG